MLRPAADPRTAATRPVLRKSPGARRGLLSGILESVGDFLGFGNNQARPTDPKDTGSGASSTPGSHEPTNIKPPAHQPSPPAQAPPALYPAPGGGGQGDKPTSSAPMPPASVSSAPSPSGSAGNAAAPAPHSTSAQDAMNVAPTLSTKPSAQQSHHVSDVHGAAATSHTVSPGLPSISAPASGAPSPTQSPSPGPQIGHAKQFPLAAAAAIGAVLGFLVVTALFWAFWLALRKRRRAYPEFASVHPKCVSGPETDGNPFVHPRDEKEDDPFDAASLWRASTARSLASTLSV